jgi:dolichyl-phosphate-mannose-protein mannosyltransferase
LGGLANGNPEHPPLAKALIAFGIFLFDDGPFGWRVMSALFGAVTLVGLYLWGMALFAARPVARWIVAISAVDQILYVQARIAMLDIFATAFLVLALAAVTASWRALSEAGVRRCWTATGLCLGLACACKWTGLTLWFALIVLAIGVRILRTWQTQFEMPAPEDWYRPDLWHAMRWYHWLLALGVLPCAVYYLSFVVLGTDSLAPWDFLQAQLLMWRDNSTLGGTHPYMSSWIDWPIIRRPIWYYFSAPVWNAPSATAQAVVSLGNPVVFWGGLVALVACGRGWILRRDRTAFMILLAYAALYLCWAVMPRKMAFSFYYLPGALILGPALAYLFATNFPRQGWARHLFLALAAAVFVWLLPISNAALTVSNAGYEARMLFTSWR